jgi:hypothetical protein
MFVILPSIDIDFYDISVTQVHQWILIIIEYVNTLPCYGKNNWATW